MAKKSSRREITVGVFVVASLSVLMIFIFLIGSRQSLFERRYELKAVFNKVSGLKPGAYVRLAGIDVGRVKEVEFSAETKVVITIEIMKKYQSRIRKDSIASIGQSGVLGDQLLDITAGAHIYAQLQEGEFIQTEEVNNFSDLLEATRPTLRNLDKTMKNLVEISDRLNDPDGDFMQTIANVNAVTKDIREGKGSVGALLADDSAYDELKEFIEGGGKALQKFDLAADDVRAFTKELPEFVKKGKAMVNKTETIIDKIDRVADNVEEASEGLPEVIVSGQDTLDEAREMINDVKGNPVYKRYFTPKENKKLMIPERRDPYKSDDQK